MAAVGGRLQESVLTAILARAEASRWIAASPNLIDMLAWHERLCHVCGPQMHCAERMEIIDEYGAGTYGAAVFFGETERD